MNRPFFVGKTMSERHTARVFVTTILLAFVLAPLSGLNANDVAKPNWDRDLALETPDGQKVVFLFLSAEVKLTTRGAGACKPLSDQRSYSWVVSQ